MGGGVASIGSHAERQAPNGRARSPSAPQWHADRMLSARDYDGLGEVPLPFFAILFSSCLNLMPDCGRVLVAERQLGLGALALKLGHQPLVSINLSAERQLRPENTFWLSGTSNRAVSINSHAERQFRLRDVRVCQFF